MAIEVKQSREYSRFRPDQLNRPTDEKHIAELMESMRADGFWEDKPIGVMGRGGTYIVVNGQNRFEAAKRLGIPVLYVVKSKKTSPDKDSKLTRRWSLRDHAGCQAQQNKTDYALLLNFSDQMKFPLGAAAALLSGKQVTCRKDLVAGNFKVASVDLAHKAAGIVTALSEHANWARHSHVLLALRILVELPGFSCSQLIDRIRTNPSMLELQPNRDGYIRLFHKLYNYRTRDNERLQIVALAEDRLRKMSTDGRERANQARARNLELKAA